MDTFGAVLIVLHEPRDPLVVVVPDFLKRMAQVLGPKLDLQLVEFLRGVSRHVWQRLCHFYLELLQALAQRRHEADQQFCQVQQQRGMILEDLEVAGTFSDIRLWWFGVLCTLGYYSLVEGYQHVHLDLWLPRLDTTLD